MRKCHVITMTVDGWTDVAQSGDLIATSRKRSAARKLARMMLDAGETDAPVEGRSPSGVLSWTHRSLAEFARFDTSEEPRPHAVKWAPNPLWAKAAQ